MAINDLKNAAGDQILSIDLMLAMILVTILLGVSADAMDLISSRMDEHTYANTLERITTENVNILINTSGTPEIGKKAIRPCRQSNPDWLMRIYRPVVLLTKH
ncbi:MAG: hypothetical protein Q8N08_07995 [Methanobacteriaceae archaeon]|nr:hypothetical protein [Methanobacteriaceae archaeon]